jgi:hypothetical protein
MTECVAFLEDRRVSAREEVDGGEHVAIAVERNAAEVLLRVIRCVRERCTLSRCRVRSAFAWIAVGMQTSERSTRHVARPARRFRGGPRISESIWTGDATTREEGEEERSDKEQSTAHAPRVCMNHAMRKNASVDGQHP